MCARLCCALLAAASRLNPPSPRALFSANLGQYSVVVLPLQRAQSAQKDVLCGRLSVMSHS